MKRITWCVLCCLVAAPTVAGELTKDFRWGSPGLQSVGPLSFGPEGILFVADTRGAAIVAIDTGDEPSRGARAPFKVEALDKKIAAMVGSSGREILINDMVVNPQSGNAYVAASRGGGPDASPILLRVEKSGKITIVSLDKVKFSRAEIPDPPPAGVQGTGRRRR
ncbi:MAG: hypothetical protein O7J95_11495, partial [Planctomycetota bacterium]|nr:hypothetical protein [Planctomycetota bacterium]